MKILILSLLAASLIWAEESNTMERLSLSVDDEGAPAFTVPMRWSEHFFSTLSYASGQTQIHESVNNANVKVEMVTGSDATNVALNVLSYEDHMDNGLVYAIGVGGGFERNDFDQVGYAYQNSSNYFAQYSTGVADIYQAGLYADIAQTKLLGFFSYRLGLFFYPLTYMDYTHTVTSVPSPTYDMTLNDKKMQNPLQYDLFVTTLFEVSSYVDLMLVGALRYRSLKRAYIDYANSSRTDYITVDYEFTHTVMIGGAKLLFPFLAYGGVSPSVGVKYSKDNIENIFSSGSSSETVVTTTTFTVGLDKPF